MTKTLRSFFSSSTSKTTDSGAKRVKTELAVQATSETAETDLEVGLSVGLNATVEAKDEVSDNGERFGWQPFDSLEPGWKASLASEFHRPYFQQLLKFLAAESKSQTIFPPSNEIFTALNLCPLEQVKVNHVHHNTSALSYHTLLLIFLRTRWWSSAKIRTTGLVRRMVWRSPCAKACLLRPPSRTCTRKRRYILFAVDMQRIAAQHVAAMMMFHYSSV